MFQDCYSVLSGLDLASPLTVFNRIKLFLFFRGICLDYIPTFLGEVCVVSALAKEKHANKPTLFIKMDWCCVRSDAGYVPVRMAEGAELKG